MSELLEAGLPWWAWALLGIGAVSVVAVFGALFLPDWPTPDYTQGFEDEPGSETFLAAAAGFLNVPVLRGGEVTLLQNGDAFYGAILDSIRAARDSVNFE
ncbi:MAG: hypothetical protein ACREMX_01785, partial [Gemmatimonadales bacterium]